MIKHGSCIHGKVSVSALGRRPHDPFQCSTLAFQHSCLLMMMRMHFAVTYPTWTSHLNMPVATLRMFLPAAWSAKSADATSGMQERRKISLPVLLRQTASACSKSSLAPAQRATNGMICRSCMQKLQLDTVLNKCSDAFATDFNDFQGGAWCPR